MADEGPDIYGWDDGMVYYRDAEGNERCVSDRPELVAAISELCADPR